MSTIWKRRQRNIRKLEAAEQPSIVLDEVERMMSRLRLKRSPDYRESSEESRHSSGGSRPGTARMPDLTPEQRQSGAQIEALTKSIVNKSSSADSPRCAATRAAGWRPFVEA